ncbi:MAG: thermonuclease family protein [Peptostreptococcaceae bacterium]
MFFYKNKLKLFTTTLCISATLFFSGCSDKSNLKLLSTDIPVEHTSSIKNPIDINNLDDSVIKATVDRVVDGDTVELIFPNNEKVDTRLLLIDTPETKHPKLGVQKYGPEASQFAKSVLHEGDTVYFQLDGKAKTDKYKRYLGYLWYNCSIHDNLELYNERVVAEGLARVGYIYNQKMYLEPLLETQEIAKSKKLNIWSIQGYVTDQGYDMSVVKGK